jgi:hypothetical protein
MWVARIGLLASAPSNCAFQHPCPGLVQSLPQLELLLFAYLQAFPLLIVAIPTGSNGRSRRRGRFAQRFWLLGLLLQVLSYVFFSLLAFADIDGVVPDIVQVFALPFAKLPFHVGIHVGPVEGFYGKYPEPGHVHGVLFRSSTRLRIAEMDTPSLSIELS